MEVMPQLIPLSTANEDADSRESTDGERQHKKARVDVMVHESSNILLDCAPTLVQFLGVRSLVRFGAACKYHQAVVNEEVKRRKEFVASAEVEVKQLFGQPDNVPLRANIAAARKLAKSALRFIDDEVQINKKLCVRDLWINDDAEDEEYKWHTHDIFLHERGKFLLIGRNGNDFVYPGGPLFILPDCFYLSAGGEESKRPSQRDMKKASEEACRLLYGQDLMQGVEMAGMSDPNWDRLCYEDPFHKFHCSTAGSYTSMMEETAMELAENIISIDAFRIAARKIVFRNPHGNMDCFWYTLEKANEMISQYEFCSKVRVEEGEEDDDSDGACDNLVRKKTMMDHLVKGLSLAHFIAPRVVQFLGVRSLLHFGAACKAHKVVVSKEVERRKEFVASVEMEVKQLLGPPESVPLRADVIAAKKLVLTARRLIDSELGFHRKLCTNDHESFYCPYDSEGEDEEYDWTEHDFFYQERKKFMNYDGSLGSLYILPNCFYFSPGGDKEAANSPDDILAAVFEKVDWLRGKEREHNISNYIHDEDEYARWDYEQPFMEYKGEVGFVQNCLEPTAKELVANGTIDAFRIVARKLFFREPCSRNCLWYTLERADELASQPMV